MSRSDPDRSLPTQARKERSFRWYLVIALLALAAIFVLQNTDKTSVNFLFATFETPLFFALLIAILLGALIGWLLPKVRRDSRREQARGD